MYNIPVLCTAVLLIAFKGSTLTPGHACETLPSRNTVLTHPHPHPLCGIDPAFNGLVWREDHVSMEHLEEKPNSTHKSQRSSSAEAWSVGGHDKAGISKSSWDHYPSLMHSLFGLVCSHFYFLREAWVPCLFANYRCSLSLGDGASQLYIFSHFIKGEM